MINRECITALPVAFPEGIKASKTTSLRLGPLDDDELVLSGNNCEATPRSVDLVHAVDELDDTLPADIGLVIGVIQFGDSDCVAHFHSEGPSSLWHIVNIELFPFR